MRRALLVCAVASAAVWAWSVSLGDALPDPMPIHWGLAGRPDGWMSRSLALGLGPLMGLGVPALVAGLVAVSPQRAELEDSGALPLVLGVLGLFGVGVQVLVVQAGLHPAAVLADRWLLALVGAMVGVLGVAMRRVPRNGLIGVRTPLTLSSDEIWDATHRVAAATMGIGALAAIASALWLPAPWHAGAAVAAVLVGALAPIPWATRTYGRRVRTGG